jgi:hypothetical protein
MDFCAAAAVAAALVAGIAVSTWQTVEARKAQRATEVARISEQQQRLEAQAAQKSAETERTRADAQARKASESQHVLDLAFSQDGSRLVIYAISGQEDSVWVVNVSSSKIESRHSALRSWSEHHGAARLSPDNQRLYLPRSDSRNRR